MPVVPLRALWLLGRHTNPKSAACSKMPPVARVAPPDTADRQVAIVLCDAPPALAPLALHAPLVR